MLSRTWTWLPPALVNTMLRTVWLLKPVDDTCPAPDSDAGVGGCALAPQVPAQWPEAAAAARSVVRKLSSGNRRMVTGLTEPVKTEY